MRAGGLMLLGVLCAGLFGCRTYVTPPANVADPVTVYVADYGRHAGLVLPTGPGTMTEYGFGDWTFFAEGKDTLPNGFVALFFSQGSALGERAVADTGDPAALAKDLKASVKGVRVERTAADRLAARLHARYQDHIGTQIHNARDKTYYVKDPEGYGLLNNSNMVTARWLRELGCETCGPALLSDFVIREPSKATAAPPATR